jgi:F0F1-type ATP synthase assembly protein I
MDRTTPGDRARANAELQESLQRAEPRIVASYALVGAILLFGAVGYGVDHWLGSGPWAMLTGLVAGFLVGFANLVVSLRR